MKNIFLVAILFQSMIATAQMPESPQVAPVSPMRAFYKSKITPASATDKITPQKWDALFGIVDSQKADIGRLASKVDTGLIAATQVYYVDRQYTNPATRAVQLSKARVGDPSRPFPTPWDARNAAIDRGVLSAMIFVQSGNIFDGNSDFDVFSEKSVNIGGNVIQLEKGLAYHGLEYSFVGSVLKNFPLINNSVVSAQASVGITAPTRFMGSEITDLGTVRHAQANIEISVDRFSGDVYRQPNSDIGLRTLSVRDWTAKGGAIMFGSKWDGIGSPNGDARVLNYHFGNFSTGSRFTGYTDGWNDIATFTRIHSKTINLSVGAYRADGYRARIASIGRSGMASDGVSSAGFINSTLNIKVGSVEVINSNAAELVGYMNVRNSRIMFDCGNVITDHHVLILSYPDCDSSFFGHRFGKVKITRNQYTTNSPVVINSPPSNTFSITSGDVESDSGAEVVNVVQGTLILKGVKIKQMTTGKSVINIAPGAKVICDCELVSADGVTPTVTGGGTFISLNAKMNIAPNQTVSVIGSPVVSSGYNY
jgi:hypothetical protein